MAINFPNTPSDGDTHEVGDVTFTYNAAKNSWLTVPSSSGGSSVVVSDTPPVSPNDGDMWTDSETMKLNVYYVDSDSSQWVEVSGSATSTGSSSGSSIGTLIDEEPVVFTSNELKTFTHTDDTAEMRSVYIEKQVPGASTPVIISKDIITLDPSVILNLNGNTTNDSSYHNVTTSLTSTNPVVVDTDVKKYGAGSLHFNGSTRLIVEDPLYLGAGDFTIEFWVKTSQTVFQITNYEYSGMGGIWKIGFGNYGNWFASGGFYFGYGQYGSYTMVRQTTLLPNADVWTHFAITRTSNIWRFFKDGVESPSVIGNSNATWNDAADFQSPESSRSIGAHHDNGSALDGWLDDFTIMAGISKYSEDFTPPTEEISPTISTPFTTSGETILTDIIDLTAVYSLTQTALDANNATTSFSYDNGTSWTAFSADHGVLTVPSDSTQGKIKVNVTPENETPITDLTLNPIPTVSGVLSSWVPVRGPLSIGGVLSKPDVPVWVWNGASSLFTHWAVFEFVDIMKFYNINIRSVRSGLAGENINHFKLYGSNDGVNWTIFYNSNVIDMSPPETDYTYTFDQPVYYKNIKITANGSSGNTQHNGMWFDHSTLDVYSFSSIDFTKNSAPYWELDTFEDWGIEFESGTTTKVTNRTGSDATARIRITAPTASAGGSAAGSGVTMETTDPLITNNGTLGELWLNTTTGELYACTDITTDDNIWTNVGDGTGNITSNVPPENPTNTTIGDQSQDSSFNHTFTGGTDTDGNVTHYIVDEITGTASGNVVSNPMTISVPEVPVGIPHQFTIPTLTDDTTISFRVRSKDNSGSYSSGVTITFVSLVGFFASGGIENTYSIGGVNYKSHTFLTSGTFVTSGGVGDMLIVAGGGAGGPGTNGGSGGGAGGMLVLSNVSMSGGDLGVVVGSGGLGGNWQGNIPGGNGVDSSIDGNIATGGGGGGQWGSIVSKRNGQDGGSGGGGAETYYGSGATSGGTGIVGQGNNGGGSSATFGGAGGGGAGGSGGSVSGNYGGVGGIGLSNIFRNGTLLTYSTGGHGYGDNGGPGSGINGADGDVNTGDGGDGGGHVITSGSSGNGGSGIVIVRYAI